ncbi:MAG: hypothetical protein IK143_01350, partial [Bacteroidales bacterium]|nr:hypothetical protein [Bacteroidales bacterium]
GETTTGEITYIFHNRNTDLGLAKENARFCKGQVGSKTVVVIFPDEWVDGSELSTSQKGVFPSAAINNTATSFDRGFYIADEDFPAYEEAGCVFIPTAGYRAGNAVVNWNAFGFFWSSTPASYNIAFHFYVAYNDLNAALNWDRFNGYPVRLVQNK